MADPEILLPSLINSLAASEPDKLFCAYADSASTADVLNQVTYKTIANAVNACAWWLRETLGDAVNFDTIAYLGPSNIQPAILTLAAAKVNRKAFLVSPRNSVAAQLQLFDTTECKVLIVAQGFQLPEPLTTALTARDTKILPSKPQRHWLEHDSVSGFPFNASLKDCPERPFVVLHTSGSTGFPKPITYTFAALRSYIAQANPKDIDPDCAPTQTDVFKNTYGGPYMSLVGTDRKAAALLIEPRMQVEGDAEKSLLQEQIGDSVQRANDLAPDFARIEKDMILFTNPDKPIVRASKGTVQRNATLEAYKKEIDQLYEESL
ncbi:acetyl-CoA synthetase-like protein [Periconia macrospinosa]|uniref:Acetyl-CoA synthetase-like protein n=1 Tax=Periconia macrospinosa TaxID=97972 RepID=A0A2V1DJ45_9PLEO|nr:acetyl-CoA synthetase-like protein [Periconia macrospinosa]